MDALNAFYWYLIIVLALYAVFTLPTFQNWSTMQRFTLALLIGAIFILFATPYVNTPNPGSRIGFTILILFAYITPVVLIFLLVKDGKFASMFQSEKKETIVQEIDGKGRVKVVKREVTITGGLSPPSTPSSKYGRAAHF